MKLLLQQFLVLKFSCATIPFSFVSLHASTYAINFLRLFSNNRGVEALDNANGQHKGVGGVIVGRMLPTIPVAGSDQRSCGAAIAVASSGGSRV